MSRQLTALGSYLEFSEAMLAAAQAGEWEELTQIGEKRSALADQAFADPDLQWPAAEQASARKFIEQCQRLDAQIRALAEERQQALRVLLRAAEPLT